MSSEDRRLVHLAELAAMKLLFLITNNYLGEIDMSTFYTTFNFPKFFGFSEHNPNMKRVSSSNNFFDTSLHFGLSRRSSEQ